MMRRYRVPVETVSTPSGPSRRPKYFMDLWNTPMRVLADEGTALVVGCDTTDTTHAYLCALLDVEPLA